MYYSPLRYPGGKTKLFNYFRLLLDKNNLFDCTYIEPYAGGAGAGLSLLLTESVKKIYINDIDKSIFSFWYSILNHTEKFCEKIHNTDINISEWKKQKNIQENLNKHDIFSVGFSAFFLNRTNRSGILGGGAIGGQSQSGKYKIDARFNKDNLIKRIKRISLYKNRIKLYNLDAIEFISKISEYISSNSILYLDPPYYKKGKGLYENHYTHDDHVNVSNFISNSILKHWVLTYDNREVIKKLYNQFRYFDYSLNYSAGNHSKGSELIIFSDNLIIPSADNPIKVNYPKT